jgi:DNA-binding transcriptional LysR family regulator
MKNPGRQRATNFEIRHLRYFVMLVEERNFERAAARLGIAQPGLSQQIIALEAIVGLPLLDRSKRSVNLTATGQALFEEAVKIVAQTDAALAKLRRVGRGESGRLMIGYVASAAYSGLFTERLAAFRSAYPEVDLQLVEMEMRQQLKRLAEGEIDFGYIRPPAPVPPGLQVMTVLREPLVVALAAGHRLASKNAIDLRDVAEEVFITPRQPDDVGFHANTLRACTEAGFKPKLNTGGRDFTTIASMVAVGVGLALVPKSMVCLRLPGVRYIPLLDNNVMSDLAVVYRKTEHNPAVKSFVVHHQNIPDLGGISFQSPP